MPEPTSPPTIETDLCVHVFAASSGLLGVCLTVIGLLRVVITLRRMDTLADDLLALNAVTFLTSCLLSYWALRHRGLRRMHRLEHVADIVFLLGLLLMVGNCGFVTYAISAG